MVPSKDFQENAHNLAAYTIGQLVTKYFEKCERTSMLVTIKQNEQKLVAKNLSFSLFYELLV